MKKKDTFAALTKALEAKQDRMVYFPSDQFPGISFQVSLTSLVGAILDHLGLKVVERPPRPPDPSFLLTKKEDSSDEGKENT